MEVTVFGIMSEPVNPLQFKKVRSPIELIPGSIIKPVNPEHKAKALAPRVVTEEGIVRVPVNPEHELKAPVPIEVTEVGIVREPVNPPQL